MAARETNDLDLGVTQRGAAAEQKLFGRYTLRKVLGRGGMGVVWLAHDDELVRNVAMKFLPDMIVRDREAVEDLKRETRRSLDLTHHHIVRIYDFTQDEQCAAIIMEYVDGESLSALKTRQDGGCFSVSTIQSWVSHFCQAMEYAHRQARVVHRDIKPANLMVNGRGDLKVTDFGISRSMSDSMTRVSMSNSAGTLAYMSPEQALGSPPAVGDDVYAFGATVYDMLTGRPPFFRGNLQVQLETVVPPPMESRRAELGNTAEPIPALWEEVIAACLAKRPHDRPQGMMEIASLLGVSGTTTVSFRPSTNRSTAGGSGPGTSPTAPAASTNRTATTPEAPKTGTASTNTPGTAGTAPSYRALQPTRAEDFGYTPTPRPTAAPPATVRTTPIVPPEDRAPVAPPVQPEPLVEAVAEPAAFIPPAEPAPVEPEPTPVVAETPPEVFADSVMVELSPVSLPLEIPLVPPTEKPPVVHEELSRTLHTPASEPPDILASPEPAPSQPAFVPPSVVPPPAPSVSTRTNVGHMIGSGDTKRSSNTGLILSGVGVIILVALLGLWAGRSPGSDHRKAELASHVEAAKAALASDDLAAAAREIDAVRSLDPKNAGLATLRSAFATKKKQAEAEEARLAADKAAADKIAAIKAEQAAVEKAARDKEIADQRALAEKEQIARQEKERMLQQQFETAIANATDAIDRRDPVTARQGLGNAQQIKPADPEIPKLQKRISALEDDLKPKIAETTPDEPSDKPNARDEPSDKPRRKPEKKPVAESRPKARREVEPEPSRPIVQRPPPSRPPNPPRRPSSPFGPGGAPGG